MVAGRNKWRNNLTHPLFLQWSFKGQPRSTCLPCTALNHKPGNCVIPDVNLWSLSAWHFQVSFYSPTNSLNALTKLWACHNLTCGMSFISLPHQNWVNLDTGAALIWGHQSPTDWDSFSWGSGPYYLELDCP